MQVQYVDRLYIYNSNNDASNTTLFKRGIDVLMVNSYSY